MTNLPAQAKADDPLRRCMARTWTVGQRKPKWTFPDLRFVLLSQRVDRMFRKGRRSKR